MPLSLVRIDDRLVHGQVVEGWLPWLKATRVLVVSDASAEDPVQCALMRLALPDGVELEILPVRAAAEAVQRAAAGRESVLVLAPGPREVLALVEGGVRLEAVNVGGLHYAAGRVQLGKAIFLSAEDVAALEALSRSGVRLEGRAVPAEPPSDVVGLLKTRG